MIVNLCLPSSLQQGQVNKLHTLESSHLQRNLWLLGEECKPIIVCNAGENAHFCAYFGFRKSCPSMVVKNVAQALTEWLFTFLRTSPISQYLLAFLPLSALADKYPHSSAH